MKLPIMFRKTHEREISMVKTELGGVKGRLDNAITELIRLREKIQFSILVDFDQNRHPGSDSYQIRVDIPSSRLMEISIGEDWSMTMKRIVTDAIRIALDRAREYHRAKAS